MEPKTSTKKVCTLKTPTKTEKASKPINPLMEISKLPVKELQARLMSQKVPHAKDALKTELLALCSLKALDLLDDDNVAEETLLGAAWKWCGKSVKELMVDVNEKGLSEDGNRWDHIRDLILDMTKQATKEKSKEQKRDAKAKKGSGGKKIDSDEDSQAELADQTTDNGAKNVDEMEPLLLNFWLHSIYMETQRSDNMGLLPGCPFPGVVALQESINELLALGRAKDIVELSNEHKDLITWVQETFGDILTVATGDMKIPGQDKSVAQFVVSNPEASLREKFEKEKAMDSGISTVLFHGTPAMNLLVILKQGFAPSGDTFHGSGVFMAETPGHSYAYADKGQGTETWTHSPFRDYGILLACEVAGNGRFVGDDEHLVTRLEAVIPRYVFVVPPSEMAKGDDAKFGYSMRKKMKPSMKKAFKKIEQGIAGSSK